MTARTFILVVTVLLLAGLVGGAIVYPRLPAVVPTHWDMHDRPNGYGPRWVGALGVPLINVAVAALMLGLPKVGRFKQNAQRNQRPVRIITVAVLGAMLLMQFFIWAKTLRYDWPLGSPIMSTIGVLIAVLGNYMGKLRRNGFVGIRTPWTLGSDAVWERTHRVGGRLFVGYGVLVAGSAVLASAAVASIFSVAGAIGMAVWAMLYSFQLSRRLRELPPTMQ